MEPFKVRHNRHHGPEAKIQESIIRFLRDRSWMVLSTHGNEFQSGFPDLYAAHSQYGTRWIEVKNSEKYVFTIAQKSIFPRFEEKGVGIWILVAATELEYKKLFEHPNWRLYL